MDVKKPTRYFQAAWVHAKLEQQGMKAVCYPLAGLKPLWPDTSIKEAMRDVSSPPKARDGPFTIPEAAKISSKVDIYNAEVVHMADEHRIGTQGSSRALF